MDGRASSARSNGPTLKMPTAACDAEVTADACSSSVWRTTSTDSRALSSFRPQRRRASRRIRAGSASAARWRPGGSRMTIDHWRSSTEQRDSNPRSPACEGRSITRRRLTPLDSATSTDVARLRSTRIDGSARTVARTTVVGTGTAIKKVPANKTLCVMERTGIEPVTSGLQSRRSPS